MKPSGSKVWRLKFRMHGADAYLALGVYPDISLAQARALRDEARANAANGVDPRRLKREAKLSGARNAANTFGNVAAQYLAKKTTEDRAASTLKKLEWIISIANKSLGNIPINEITPAIVLKCLKKREAMGHYETAKKLRSTIGAIFRYAIASSYVENDPTYALKDALISHKVRHQPAIVDRKEFGAFLVKLDAYNGRAKTRIAMNLMILFAVRPVEIRSARWEDFDFENRVWTVPAGVMKMREEHKVYLSQSALGLLNELESITGKYEFLFPAATSSKKPISENTLNQALRRMGYSRDVVTSHGMRSTFSTIANDTRLFRADAIEAYLAHVEKNQIRRAYNRGSYWDERIEIGDWWAEELNAMRKL